MQISAPTLENTYPTCNYVNCLWLFIQLFTPVFAHAFICHIRGWRWCPESGRLSPQALWTDNRLRENPPLQSCAAELTPSQRRSYGGKLLWRGRCGPARRYTRSMHVHPWPIVQIFCTQTFFVITHTELCFIFFHQIWTMWHFKPQISSNISLLVKLFNFWRAGMHNNPLVE